jgi:hypothetical protein
MSKLIDWLDDNCFQYSLDIALGKKDFDEKKCNDCPKREKCLEVFNS